MLSWEWKVLWPRAQIIFLILLYKMLLGLPGSRTSLPAHTPCKRMYHSISVPLLHSCANLKIQIRHLHCFLNEVIRTSTHSIVLLKITSPFFANALLWKASYQAFSSGDNNNDMRFSPVFWWISVPAKANQAGLQPHYCTYSEIQLLRPPKFKTSIKNLICKVPSVSLIRDHIRNCPKVVFKDHFWTVPKVVLI